MEWLEKFLGKPGRWWKHHGRSQPLMAEIVAPLKHPRNIERLVSAGVVVRVFLRDRPIDLLNLRRSPTLAFKDTPPNFESLVWFLDELKKDLGSSSSHNSIGASVAGGTKRSLEDEGTIIEEILQKLKSHSNCQYAWFVDAANAFKVISKDKGEKRFTVKWRNKNEKGQGLRGPPDRQLGHSWRQLLLSRRAGPRISEWSCRKGACIRPYGRASSS